MADSTDHEHELIDITALGSPKIVLHCFGCGESELHDYAPLTISGDPAHSSSNSAGSG